MGGYFNDNWTRSRVLQGHLSVSVSEEKYVYLCDRVIIFTFFPTDITSLCTLHRPNKLKSAFSGHLLSVSSNDKNNAINGLQVCITIRKVVLLDILSQMVQKLGFIMR